MKPARFFAAGVVAAVLGFLAAVAPARATYIPSPLTYVVGYTNGSPGTWEALTGNVACNGADVGWLAVVSDLYGTSSAGGVNESLRCTMSGAPGSQVYYWRPQRTDYAASVAAAGTSMSLIPLASPPIMVLTGSLAGNTTLTPSATNASPGECFLVNNQATLGAFLVTISGLLGAGQTLIGGATKQLCYTGSGWQAL